MGYQGTLRFMRTAGGLTHHNALRKKITKVAVTRLVFLDDHGMLTDIAPSSDDWRKGGTRYVDKQGGAHWLADGESFPASITKATRLSIEVDLEVDSPDADPIECVIHATPTLTSGDSGAPEALTFEARVEIGGQPMVKTRLRAMAPLADQVFALGPWTLTWTCEAAAATFSMGRTGPHQLYVTYARPDPGGRRLVTPFGSDDPPLEDGITHKRTDAAVRITEEQWRQAVLITDPETGRPMDRNDPHVLAQILNASVPGYTLAKDPSVPAGYKHPTYLAQDEGVWKAGAWPLVDYREQRAECQAIVRYIRASLMQIGCPGQAELVAVYAHVGVAGGATALVDSMLPPDSDASKYRLDMHSGAMYLMPGLHRDAGRLGFVGGVAEWQTLLLADDHIAPDDPRTPDEDVVGEFYPPGSVFNRYEACLRFTHAGKTRYHAGGVFRERFISAQDVLEASFWGLVWTSSPKDAPRTDARRWTRVDEIVRRYHGE